METMVKGLPSSYEIEHLVRVFYPGAPVRKTPSTKGELAYARVGGYRMAAAIRTGGSCVVGTAPLPAKRTKKELVYALSRLVYGLMLRQGNERPLWGMLTGVRPVRLLRRSLEAGGEAAAKQKLLCGYDVSEEKYNLVSSIQQVQAPLLAACTEHDYSLYISIPFCPSRCSYCSFVSRTIEREGHLVGPYMEKLCEELAETAAVARAGGLRLQTVYIGGGTPTALTLPQLAALLAAVQKNFDTGAVREYTVEAGRPDCTSSEKLALLKKYGVTRISINPQTMSDEVLARIGRRHSAADILRCSGAARAAGHDNINMDIIAGLPGDTPEGFAGTVSEILRLAPENITLHTLTLKRASDYVIDGQSGAALPQRMLEEAYPRFAAAGYRPYYLYRQKSTVENLENTGWMKKGRPGLYNIYIMEEVHTILAVGAGASTKLVAQNGNRMQRIYNHKFPTDYISRFDEILDKKRGVIQFYAGHLDSQTPG